MVATALKDRKADIGDATFGIGIFQMVYYEFLALLLSLAGQFNDHTPRQ